MDTSPYSYLDALTKRLRAFPEVEALLKVDPDAPQRPMPHVPPLPILDTELAKRWLAIQSVHWARANQVAGGGSTIQRAAAVIQANLTALDVITILAECASIYQTETDFAALAEDNPDWDRRSRDGAAQFVISRMILSDDQFRQMMDVEQAVMPYLLQLRLRQN